MFSFEMNIMVFRSIQIRQDSLAMMKNLVIFGTNLSPSVKHAALATLIIKLSHLAVVLVILVLVGTIQIPHYQQVVTYAPIICGVIDHLKVVVVVSLYKKVTCISMNRSQ